MAAVVGTVAVGAGGMGVGWAPGCLLRRIVGTVPHWRDEAIRSDRRAGGERGAA